MSTPSLATEAALAGNYPSARFNQRERKLLASVQEYVDSLGAITASHRVVAGGLKTTASGSASQSITAAGVLATDLVMVMVKTAGATPRSIVAAAAGSGSISVTMSGDPSTDHVLQYVVFRAL